jgi:hypothetical protein
VYLSFSGGAARCADGTVEHPSVTIRTPAALWLDITGGLRNPVWALVTLRITVEGRRSLLRLLPTLLTKTAAVPAAPVRADAPSAPRRVLALIGNPRRKNGLTWFYLQPFLEGMRRAGAAVEEIMLYDRKINHCLGCFQCWTRTPGQCVQKDDQAELMEKMNAADLVVYAVPLYYHSLPGLVKDHFDRQLPMVHPYMEEAGGVTRHPRRQAGCSAFALFSICGFPEIEQFDPLVRTMETYVKLGGSKLAATMLIPGAMKLYHDPTQRSRLLEKLRHLGAAGEQIVRTGGVDRRTARAVAKVRGPLSAWRSDSNRFWHDELTRGRAARQQPQAEAE